MKRSIIPIFVPHLGCPHECVFCNQRKIAGTQRAPSPGEVRALIEEGLCASGKSPEIAFYGGSFTAVDRSLQEALLDAAHPYVRSGRVSSIRVSTRPDCIDGDILAILKGYGVATIELGAQSTDDDVLKRSGRGHTARDIADAANQVKDAGLLLILQLMCGLPGDTREKDVNSAKEAAALKPDGARIYPVVVLRDTALYERYRDGSYVPLGIEEAASVASDMLEVFEDAGIPVIRIGLNPTEELSNGAAAAGAYHPALGEMTRSRLYFKRALGLLSGASLLEAVFGVNPSCISLMVGQKRENIMKLQELFPGVRFKIKPAEVPPGRVILLENESKTR